MSMICCTVFISGTDYDMRRGVLFVLVLVVGLLVSCVHT